MLVYRDQRVSNEELCFYDSNGNVNPISRSTRCLRSLESIEEGHWCVPTEPSLHTQVSALKNAPFRVLKQVFGVVLQTLSPLLLALFTCLISLLILFWLIKYPLQWSIFSKRKIQRAWGHVPTPAVYSDAYHTSNAYIFRVCYLVNTYCVPALPLVVICLVLVEFLTLPCLVTSSKFKLDTLLVALSLKDVSVTSPKTSCHRRFSFRVGLFAALLTWLVCGFGYLLAMLCKRGKDIRRIGQFMMKVDPVNQILRNNWGLFFKWVSGRFRFQVC